MNFTQLTDNEIMSRLIADVVHKIKNGLGGIGGYATLLEKEFTCNDPKIRFVKKINDGVVSVNEISVKLMSLVRIRELQKEKIRIEYLFREILKNISRNNYELIDKLYFDNTFHEKYIEIISDQDVLGELFKNSIQFLQEITEEIYKIQITSSKDKNLLIHIHFKKKFENQKNFSDYIKHLMQDSRHLYERLCFAIIQKMIVLLSGTYSTESKNNEINILKLEI
ncbi:MAG: hypothetical protein R6V04_07430 [bacterium]